jgi:hypothetical protein
MIWHRWITGVSLHLNGGYEINYQTGFGVGHMN